MIVINYSQFRKNLAGNLNSANDDKELVIVTRPKGKKVVIMDLEEYNSMNETIYLTKSSANKKRLDKAIKDISKGKYKLQDLIEK